MLQFEFLLDGVWNQIQLLKKAKIKIEVVVCGGLL